MKSTSSANETRPFRFSKYTVVEIISALFILLFLYTAINKSFHIGNTRSILTKTPFFKNFASETAWVVVIIEYLVSALLLIPKTKRLGLYVSLLLMIAFNIYIVYMMIFIPNLPCSCGGVISKMTWTQHLIFNGFFTLLAIAGIVLQRIKSKIDSQRTGNPPVVFT